MYYVYSTVSYCPGQVLKVFTGNQLQDGKSCGSREEWGRQSRRISDGSFGSQFCDKAAIRLTSGGVSFSLDSRVQWFSLLMDQIITWPPSFVLWLLELARCLRHVLIFLSHDKTIYRYSWSWNCSSICCANKRLWRFEKLCLTFCLLESDT